ncbi:galactolipase DONGLE, chloroplastic-like [Magnolia sinica]|uniref:galactolipase DONGLE, chloroplastic-like n=1 Tax=Magnolia sinica TaxID=86752 RepID=UPI00265A17BD|nr:galactolipase DONGLE, chloroplastic-like [Magnolia sinica]
MSLSLSINLSMASTIFTSNPSLLFRYTRLRRPQQCPLEQLKVTQRNVWLRRWSVEAASMVAPVVKTKAKAGSRLARVWREIQGVDDWEDFVEPMNTLLQDEIMRYAVFVMVCYMACDLEPTSKRFLNCKYGKKNMLREVGMDGCGYEVTKYIYMTPDSSITTQFGTCPGRWIGYVAVSSDDEVKRLRRRDIIVIFHGMVTNTEWTANLISSLIPARLDPHNPRPDVKVESSYMNLYTSDDSVCKFSHGSCREQLLSELSRIIKEYRDEELSITISGHSMGGSLAWLLAYDIAELGLNRDGLNHEVPITVCLFDSPSIGNSSFKERCEELGVNVLRIVNGNKLIIEHGF